MSPFERTPARGSRVPHRRFGQRVARMFRSSASVALALLVSACTASGPAQPRPPQSGVIDGIEPTTGRASVGLVLGAGGSRGFAHLGVIKVLEEASLRPDLVVGASVGSVIAALYCAGLGIEELERIALELDRSDVLDFNPFSGGVFSGVRLQEFVNRAVHGRPIESLRTPLAVVATERASRSLVAFTRGDTGLAVRASSSIPIVFAAPWIEQKAYVDAAVVDPLPTSIARRLGAEVVLAVNLMRRPDARGSGRTSADVVIDVVLPRTRMSDFSQRQAQISAGEAAARALLPRMRHLIERQPG